MANLTTTTDLLADVLFRSGEPGDGSSDWQAQILSYLNRAYRTIWQGGAEFDPTINEAWWWLRAPSPGVIVLRPAETIEAALTRDSVLVTFPVPPAASRTGWWLTAPNHDAAFRIVAHSASLFLLSAELDAPWTGDTGTVTVTLRQLEYDLPVTLLHLIAPMRSPNGLIALADPGGGMTQWPTRHPVGDSVSAATPAFFAPVGERRVRFSSVPSNPTRVEFDWLARPADLTGVENEEPIIPRQYRHLISDGAVYFTMVDKNDNRADTAGLLLKAGLKAMQREHRHRMIAQNPHFGHLSSGSPRRWIWDAILVP